MDEKFGRVGILNCGMGNIKSVFNGFHAVGGKPYIIDDPNELANAKRIVLPGVGAFADGINALKKGKWIDALNREVLERKKPFFAMCLGMQLLASYGEEHGPNEGLGWLKGCVKKMPPMDSPYRIPHIGWNEVKIVKESTSYMQNGRNPIVYFAHSYKFEPEDINVVSGWTTHGREFVASVEFENIRATQFHPEKSQSDGLSILKKFLIDTQNA